MRKTSEAPVWSARSDSMSLCKLYYVHSLGTRPVNWRWFSRERLNVSRIVRVSGGPKSTTRQERSQSSWPDDDGESDGVGGINPWDSNVESVRRRNRNRFGGREASSPATTTPDWLTPKKGWTFNSDENKSEETRNKPDEELPWWKSSKGDGGYDDEEADEEEEEDYDDEEYDGFGVRSDQLYSSLRWGIPVSFVVLPWLLGNPFILLLGLAAVPAVQRAVGPVVSEVWEAILDLSESPSKRRRRTETDEPGSDEVDDAYSSWSGERDNARPYRYKKSAVGEPNTKGTAESFTYSDSTSNINRIISRRGGQPSRKPGESVSMGGWDDLEDDRSRRMPVRRQKRQSKLGWKSRSRRKEKPLFVRLLFALFPFLRNWGGWLSLFLLFPFLGNIEISQFI